MLQVVREYTSKVDHLVNDHKDEVSGKEQAAKEEAAQEATRNAYATLTPLALPPANMGDGYYNQPHAAAFGLAPDPGYGTF